MVFHTLRKITYNSNRNPKFSDFCIYLLPKVYTTFSQKVFFSGEGQMPSCASASYAYAPFEQHLTTYFWLTDCQKLCGLLVSPQYKVPHTTDNQHTPVFSHVPVVGRDVMVLWCVRSGNTSTLFWWTSCWWWPDSTPHDTWHLYAIRMTTHFLSVAAWLLLPLRVPVVLGPVVNVKIWNGGGRGTIQVYIFKSVQILAYFSH